MPYLELSFELDHLDPQAAETACMESGALCVTLCDASDEPVLEPRPGEVRLWRQTRLQALYHAARADAALIVTLAAAIGIDPLRLTARAVADRAWEREWLRDFHAMRFGSRLWICPRHESVADPQGVVVRLEPGLAFGAGTHPSTAACLQWLDGAALSGSTVVDYGCGAGALAIAALKLGARRAYAFDIDPQALLATRENALDNAVADRLQLCERASDIPHGCDVLLANILAEVLISLRPQFAQLLPAGARVLLAGILADQESEVAAAFLKWFDMQRYAHRDGWVALTGTRY
ncbi:MAG TPA: 50S ribosomal protein L11 methyltransferase [Steroidobacteraceae bacterium]|jgi:ribosomal protein L11 methyltransferase|nr:50S ribosomal protein L11 methyltransferase [Steroidobacteraceae bacterium]